MESPPLLIADSSTLLNFLVVERMDLMLELGYSVHVVDAVIHEIKTERVLLDRLLKEGAIKRVVLDGPQITATVASFTEVGLGAGEALSYAAAIELNCAIAIDDRRAVKRATSTAGHLPVITTADIVLAAIKENRIELQEAEALKLAWEQNHKFRLRFDSFAVLLEDKSN
jgi:predicted nucleic acid-binding protein